MTDSDHLVHVSGHPARDELRKLYRLVKPRFSVPVHGEWRHLAAHAGLARELSAIRPILSRTARSWPSCLANPEVTNSAPVGRKVLDGSRLVPLQGGVMAARRRMLGNGFVLGSLAVDRRGTPPRRAAGGARPGFSMRTTRKSPPLGGSFAAALADLPASLRRDDDALADAARAALRRVLGRRYGKRPQVDVHLLRV